MAEIEKYRDRKFVAILYPEDETHAACMEKLKTGGYNFAAILHDKDVQEDGQLKKPHWHLVLRFKNAVWNTATAKQLGIAPNYLEVCDTLDGSLLYLVHFNQPNKYQYDLEEVFGPLQLNLATLLSDSDEGTRALHILEIIKNTPGPIGYSELLRKAAFAGLYSDLRRMGSFAVGLMREHNYECTHTESSNAGVMVSREAFEDYCRWTGTKMDDLRPL